MLKTKEITINGQTYKLTQLPASKACDIGLKITSISMKSKNIKSINQSNNLTEQEMAEAISAEIYAQSTFEDVYKAIENVETDIEIGGKITRQSFSGDTGFLLFERHFAGKFGELMELWSHAIVFNLGETPGNFTKAVPQRKTQAGQEK